MGIAHKDKNIVATICGEWLIHWFYFLLGWIKTACPKDWNQGQRIVQLIKNRAVQLLQLLEVQTELGCCFKCHSAGSYVSGFFSF